MENVKMPFPFVRCFRMTRAILPIRLVDGCFARLERIVASRL